MRQGRYLDGLEVQRLQPICRGKVFPGHAMQNFESSWALQPCDPSLPASCEEQIYVRKYRRMNRDGFWVLDISRIFCKHLWCQGIPSVDLVTSLKFWCPLARGSAQRWDVLVTAPVPSMGLALPQGAHHKAKPSTSKAWYSIGFSIESNHFSSKKFLHMVCSRYGVALWSCLPPWEVFGPQRISSAFRTTAQN